jgi:hypothetical protein
VGTFDSFDCNGLSGKHSEVVAGQGARCSNADVGIETIKTELVHCEVLVKAAQEDIGVQYSDRSSHRKVADDKPKIDSLNAAEDRHFK